MAERLDIVSQSNFPTNKSNTVEIVTTTKKKVTTASASDIATLVTPAISNLDIATQTNFPIQESDAQSDFIITTDGGVNNVTAEAAASLVASYIPTGGGGDPHEPDFTEDYSTNYSDFSNFTGSGTEADPYQIWNEKMFLNARFKVNNGGLSDATYFKQMRDIVWQFDGIGWGMHINNIYIYNTENTEIISQTSYGVSTSAQYINYNGNNHKLIVQYDNFVYNNDFIDAIVNYTDPHGNITTSNSMNIFSFSLYLFNVNILNNLELIVTGQCTNQLSTIYYNIIFINTKINNVIINNLYYEYSNNFNLEALIRSYSSSCVVDNIKFFNVNINSGGRLGYVYYFNISSDSSNIVIENCFSDTITYISKPNHNKNIDNLYINNCNFLLTSNTGSALIECNTINNCTIENSQFYGNSSYNKVILIKANYINRNNLRNLYIECYGFNAFNIKNKLYVCSILGYIWCKQLADNTEHYIMKYIGESALPEGEYTVNYCKNSAVFFVDSNSKTYNEDTHAYLEADTTESSGDVDGVVLANI